MATIYFTTNADSGSGSLRKALESAAPGDVISPDPVVFSTSNSVEILLSSRLPFPSGVTIAGYPNCRIKLNGQGTVTFAVLAVAGGERLTFRYVDIASFYRSGNAPCFVNSIEAGGVLSFENCRIYDNTGTAGAGFLATSATAGGSLLFSDCLCYGNSRPGNDVVNSGAFLRLTTNGSTTATFTRCTLDNASEENPNEIGGRISDVSQIDSLIAGYLEGFTPDNAGFVSRSGRDYRLVFGSDYLRGASSVSAGGVDVLGRPRRECGAIGAFEGATLHVFNGETYRVEDDFTVDDLELEDGAALSSDAEKPVFVRAIRSAIIDGGAVFSTETRSYLVVPANAAVSASAVFEGFVLCRYGASASNFTVSTHGASWTSAVPTVPVLLEINSNGEWTTLATTAGESWNGAVVAGTMLRLYDGNADKTFLVETAQQIILPLGFHPWGDYDATITVDTSSVFNAVTGYVMMSSYYNQGETPLLLARVTNSQTNEVVDVDNVDSISYTCFKKSFAWSNETRTPVVGHENVAAPVGAVLSELVTNDPRWTADTTGYNFIFEPECRDKPLFPSSGDYVVVVTIRFTNANPLPLVYDISVT